MAIINEGELLLQGQPSEVIKNVESKIWEKVIEKNELKKHQEKYNIISSRLFTGKIIIHAYSNSNPDSFKMVAPSLEDVYFSTIKNMKQTAIV